MTYTITISDPGAEPVAMLNDLLVSFHKNEIKFIVEDFDFLRFETAVTDWQKQGTVSLEWTTEAPTGQAAQDG